MNFLIASRACQTLQRTADSERFINILHGQACDESSTPWPDFDQAFGGELLNRAADGRQADAEPVGQFVDIQSFAGPQERINNGRSESIVNRVDRALPLQFDQFHVSNVTAEFGRS